MTKGLAILGLLLTLGITPASADEAIKKTLDELAGVANLGYTTCSLRATLAGQKRAVWREGMALRA